MKTVGFLIQIVGTQLRNILAKMVCRMRRICRDMVRENTLRSSQAFDRLQWLIPQRQHGARLTRNGKTSLREQAVGATFQQQLR